MEDKALELYEVNVKLKNLNASLEDQIDSRTRELQDAIGEAEAAKNAERDFLAKMSHEIRTPMNAVLGMTHLMFDTQLSSDQKELVNSIHYSANLLKSLISDILEISKIEAGAVEYEERDFNLKELLVAIQKTFSFNLKNTGVDVEVSYDRRLPEVVCGDDVIINQILMNLVGNSAKFTESGCIKIEADFLHNGDSGPVVKLVVQDSGIGIAEEKLALIFESFNQASRDINMKYGGTGLGLAITKHLVELAKGEIDVKSSAGVGTTFAVTIPLKTSQPHIQEFQEYSDSADLSHAGKILLVEDNPMNYKYAGKLLDKWGLTWDLAENGAIAVEKCNSGTYALILMDIQMPELDGHEATILIRSKQNPNVDVPIIGLSAFAFEHEVAKAINAGMNDHLTKPFAPSDLKKKIVEHLGALPGQEFVEDEFAHHEMLDASYLENFYEGDLQYMLEMFEVFLKNISSYQESFDGAVQSEDWAEVSALAHKVKPTFAMIGLHQKQEIMLRLEQEGRQEFPNVQEIKKCHQEFEELVEDLVPILMKEVIRIKDYLQE